MSKFRNEDECYQKIADAIVGKAIKDYVNALKIEDERTIAECEAFFKSARGQLFARVDADTIISRCRKGVLAFKEKAGPFLEAQEEKQNAFKCPICDCPVNIRYLCVAPRAGVYKYRAKCDGCNFACD